MRKIPRKKGFTLVELIVVLVILAILAAIAIPAMTGWIEKAQGRAYVADARQVYIAAQSAVSEAYGTNADFSKSIMQTYSGSTKCGRVSSWFFYKVQNNQSTAAEYSVEASITKNVLAYLDCENKSTARYKFTSSTGPTANQTVYDYYTKNNKQPGIIIIFLADGTVDYVEFGYEHWLVHIDKNGTTATKDGKFSAKGSAT